MTDEYDDGTMPVTDIIARLDAALGDVDRAAHEYRKATSTHRQYADMLTRRLIAMAATLHDVKALSAPAEAP